MRVSSLTVAILADVLLAPRLACATGNAYWVQPTQTWLGIDGLWSHFDYLVGAPAQRVSLSVNTILSEFWVVEDSGCTPNVLCHNARGQVFDISESNSWTGLGEWALPIDGGNGDFGLETLVASNSKDRRIAVDNALVAGINTTNFYTGYIGVGVTQTAFDTSGSMGRVAANPYISQLSETYGFIPSHSYAYTAGAQYVGNNGTPASLTYGGYDRLRFDSSAHSDAFSLNQVNLMPSVRLRGVTAEIGSTDHAPASGWNSTTKSLLSFNDSVTAIIDTTYPFLELPTSICERFASALGLVWDSEFEAYTFAEQSHYYNFLQQNYLSFTFTVSSFDNADNFGRPLETRGTVNVTVPSRAFALTFEYPYKNKIAYGDPSVPYFPLKRSTSERGARIGRAFMQEAYMIVKYDMGTFSLHQAQFPDNALTNRSVVNIDRPPNSPYPAYEEPQSDGGLTTGQTVGIVMGALVVGVIIAVLTWYCCRRKRRKQSVGLKKTAPTTREEEVKECVSAVDEPTPVSPVSRMFSVITRRCPRRTQTVRSQAPPPTQDSHVTQESTAVEVAADQTHEVYELPASNEPVELDSPHDGQIDDTLYGVTTADEAGHTGSSYEAQRRHLQRQLQGPAPAYTPPAVPSAGKSDQDTASVAHHRPVDENPSPISSPSYGNHSNSIPSPLTPHGDWSLRYDASTIPNSAHHHVSPQNTWSTSNPATYQQQQPTLTLEPTVSRTSSSHGSAGHSPIGPVMPPTPTFQRTPIEPGRVVCLGPLPENMQLPQPRASVPQLAPPKRSISSNMRSQTRTQVSQISEEPPTQSIEERPSTSSTLGSNFTIEEAEAQTRDSVSRQGTQPSHHQPERTPRAPNSYERIDTGFELIHVPQVADKRYSWEQ